MAGLLDVLANLSQDDLDEVDREIETLEAKLNGLREARRVVAGKLGLLPKRGGVPGKRRSKSVDPAPSGSSEAAAAPVLSRAADSGAAPGTKMDLHRRRVREYLMANGREQQSVLIRKTGVPPGSITAVLDHCWFKKVGQMVELAEFV